ncbi:MAG: NADH-quinone oxidoreductase subunit H [Nitrospirae bacterium]|nr:NADH-quinone oxidoreductase subunit H [Nitrospirota bacterium]
MNDPLPYVLTIVQAAALLLLAPFMVGWVRLVKARLQNRRGAGPLQPYRDIRKLFAKEAVVAANASWIFRFTPYLVFGVTVLAGAIVPILAVDLPLAPVADVIALVAIFALARFFIALAGLDVGTAFGGMGSSREMTIASLAEPAMLMAIFATSLITHSTSLSTIVAEIHKGVLLKPSFAFALIAFVLIALAENGRIPVDNPATHLELTMIHEAMILEYSGRHLAMIEWAGMMKLMLFSLLGIALFAPWGIAGTPGGGSVVLAFGVMAAKLLAIATGLPVLEMGLAKLRFFRVSEFLGVAFLLATLAILSHFILER